MWERQAACKGMDVRLFFDYEETPNAQPPDEAKAACRRCPVRESCLEEALKFEPFGFRGGETAGGRRKLRKALGIKAIPIHDYLTFNPEVEGLLSDIHSPEPVDPQQLALFST